MRTRKRKNTKRNDEEKDVAVETESKTQTRGTITPGLAELLAPVAFTQTQKPYHIDDKYQVPPLVFRQVLPFASLRGGFRLSSENETDDTAVLQTGWDPTGINGTDHFVAGTGLKAANEAKDFEPATPMAHRFVVKAWPFYDRLFRSSLKQAGTDVTFNSFITITNLTIELVSLLKDVQNLKALTEPSAIPAWELIRENFATSQKLYNKSLERRFLGQVEIAAGLPAIKGIISEVTRMKSPFIPVGGEGTLVVPMEYLVSGGSTSTPSINTEILLGKIDLILSILRGDYSDEIAAMKRHMPYTLADTSFIGMLPAAVDPFRSDGLINSDMTYNNVSGNESDESTMNALILNEDAAGIGFVPFGASQDISEIDVTNTLHTVVPGGMPLLSLLSASIWVADNDALDKDYALLTPHLIGGARIPYSFTYNICNIYAQDSNVLATDHSHLKGPLSLGLIDIGGEAFYLPYGRPCKVDLDAAMSGIQKFTDTVFDLTPVGVIDELGKTSMAPVTHPAVSAARDLG